MSRKNSWSKAADVVSEVVAWCVIDGERRPIIGPEDKIRSLIPEGASIQGYDTTYTAIQRARRIIEQERQQLIAAT